jgi:hypothetical protein
MTPQSFDYGAWPSEPAALVPGDGFCGPPEPMRAEVGQSVQADSVLLPPPEKEPLPVWMVVVAVFVVLAWMWAVGESLYQHGQRLKKLEARP